MKFSNVVIANLSTIEECDSAVGSIENDYQNCQGGITAWNSGYETHMLAGAAKKLEAIQRKSDNIWHKQVKNQHAAYIKANGPISLEEYEEHHIC